MLRNPAAALTRNQRVCRLCDRPDPTNHGLNLVGDSALSTVETRKNLGKTRGCRRRRCGVFRCPHGVGFVAGGGGFIVPELIEGKPSSGPTVPKGGVPTIEGAGRPVSSAGEGAGLVGPTGVLGCKISGAGARTPGGDDGACAAAMPLAVRRIKAVATARRFMAGDLCRSAEEGSPLAITTRADRRAFRAGDARLETQRGDEPAQPVASLVAGNGEQNRGDHADKAQDDDFGEFRDGRAAEAAEGDDGNVPGAQKTSPQNSLPCDAKAVSHAVTGFSPADTNISHRRGPDACAALC